MDVIDIVKAKLPSEKVPSDELLGLYVEEVQQSILTYCNRDDIPSELTFVHANMVVDLIKGENPEDNQTVKSIKEGDVQVSFEKAHMTASEVSTSTILTNYTSQLNRHRKLRW
ncbi:hypothetical protein ACSVDA_15480 [Cytobacillus sp. Hm23]